MEKIAGGEEKYNDGLLVEEVGQAKREMIWGSVHHLISKVKESFSSRRTSFASSLEQDVENMDLDFQTKVKKAKEKIHHHHADSAASVAEFRYEAFHTVLGKPEVEVPDDLFRKIKFLLVVGRVLLGVIPFSGVFKKSYKQLYLYLKSPAAIVSLTILTILTFNLSLETVGAIRASKRNAFEIAQSVRGVIQSAWSCLIYLYFLVRGKTFLSLFYHWAKTSIFYTIEDRHLKRDVIFITIVVLSSAILENAILHLEYIPALDDISGERFSNSTTSDSFLKTYYLRSHQHWSNYIPFHEIVAIIVFLQHKCMLYTCNYVDIMLTLFSRAIYFKFKMLYKLGYQHLAKPAKKGINLSKSSKIMNRYGWIQLAHDHKKLCDLLHQFESFFSPLVFGSYAVNIFYICVQLLDGISTNISPSTVAHSVYAPWSFLHIIMRVYLVSISAARINSYAHQIRAVLQECPIDCYHPEIARTDRKVTTGPEIGLTGFGAFTVTKPFILKIISVVFTFEIVLLQGKPSNNGPGCSTL